MTQTVLLWVRRPGVWCTVVRTSVIQEYLTAWTGALVSRTGNPGLTQSGPGQLGFGRSQKTQQRIDANNNTQNTSQHRVVHTCQMTFPADAIIAEYEVCFLLVLQSSVDEKGPAKTQSVVEFEADLTSEPDPDPFVYILIHICMLCVVTLSFCLLYTHN